MKYRLFRFILTDYGKLVAVILGIVVLAAAGALLNRAVCQRMLVDNAESTAQAWAGTLLLSAVDLPSTVTGGTPSAESLRLLDDAVKVGDIYRFRLWDMRGHQVLKAGRMEGVPFPKSMAERCGPDGVVAVRAGSSCTTLDVGRLPANPSHYACSYVPVSYGGAVVGVLEVYVDVSQQYVHYRRAIFFCELIAVFGVLMAGGFPVFMAFRKMRAHRLAQAEAQYLADHDSLTGVANRQRLQAAGKSALAWSRRSQTPVAALMLDLDRFKDINDTHGHAAGDELLRQFSSRMRAAIREEDTLGRLGGDEFAILQMGIEQPSGARALADRLLAMFSEPYDLNGTQIFCAASIGVALAPADATDWDTLLSCADVALYRAKDAGRRSVCFFEPGMDASLRDRRSIEKDLRRAIETNALRLAFQPLYTYQDNTLLGFEATLRWPEGWPARSPDEFIPVAEECGLILPIGAWTIKTACQCAAGWPVPLKIAVKLSPVQFRQGDIVAVVEEALKLSGLDPSRLEIEVTEALWIKNPHAVIDRLKRLRRLGVSIALNDFGSGYSILKYLWKFHFDWVKIDRSLMEGRKADPRAAAIVNTIAAMGKALHLSVTAEGVETGSRQPILLGDECGDVEKFLQQSTPPQISYAL